MKRIIPPPDKAISHRALILASLCPGESVLKNVSLCEDVEHTINCLKKMGVWMERRGNVVRIKGGNLKTENLRLYCGGSASTMRFLCGLLCGLGAENVILDGDETLRKRPMKQLANLLLAAGASLQLRRKTWPPIIIEKSFPREKNFFGGVVSAQVKTALLFNGLVSSKKSVIVEKYPSRTHTENLLKLFGADISFSGRRIVIRKSGLSPANLKVPGDFSSAAPFVAAAVLKKGLAIKIEKVGLNEGRIGFLRVLKRMGARVECHVAERFPEPCGTIHVAYSPALKATKVEAEEVPSLIDEIPLLSLVMARAKGLSVIKSANLLRIKESDRLKAVNVVLKKVGVENKIRGGSLFIKGGGFKGRLKHDGFGDHRIIMALHVLKILGAAEVKIIGKGKTDKSYPNFKRDFYRI